MPAALVPLFNGAGRLCPEISPPLLAAQAKQESINFDPKVIDGRRLSPVGAMGLAQFMPATWAEWGNGGNPFNPADAIAAQARLMCALAHNDYVVAANGDRVSLMLAAYNAGPNALYNPHTGYRGIPNYPETKRYVQRIRSLMQ